MADMSPTNEMSKSIDVQIASGSALSDAINLQGGVPDGILMSAAWTAAELTFQVGETADGTFYDLYNADGTEFTVTVAAAGTAIVLDTPTFYAWRFLKVRSGTSGTPVNQGADRDLVMRVGLPTTPQ